MRIGIVCPYSFDAHGGVQVHVMDLAGELFRRGHEVQVLAPASQDTELPDWVTSAGDSIAIPYNGSVADAAHLKNLTSEIIGRFVSAVASATRQTYGDGPLTRYEAELVIPEETAAEILLLKGIAVRYVMEPREHEPVYLRQRTLIFDLADVLMTGGGKGIDLVLLDVWHRAENDDARLRVVVDQIASLTDTSARAWHARLCGMFSEV